MKRSVSLATSFADENAITMMNAPPEIQAESPPSASPPISIREFYESFHASQASSQTGAIELLKQHRRLMLVRSLLSTSANLTVLVGCGSGKDLNVISRGKVVGIDISRKALTKAKCLNRKSSLILADAHTLPIRERIADQVVISETLEHLVEPARALKEIGRICTQSANFVLTSPNELSLWGFARKVGESILRKKLASAGQPIDDWFTVYSIKALLKGVFAIISIEGAWYFPPLGKGKTALESRQLAAVMKRAIVLDILLGKFLPYLGHTIALRATPLRPKVELPAQL